MADLHRRAVLGQIFAGAFVASAGVSLLPANAIAAPMIDAIPDSLLQELPVEKAAVRCWWRGGRRICHRRPVRRVCWWRAGRRVCAWR